jgi:type III secretory pathway component EscV
LAVRQPTEQQQRRQQNVQQHALQRRRLEQVQQQRQQQQQQQVARTVPLLLLLRRQWQQQMTMQRDLRITVAALLSSMGAPTPLALSSWVSAKWPGRVKSQIVQVHRATCGEVQQMLLALRSAGM